MDFQELVATLRQERIFLRHAQISDFIQQSKSDKRKAVASIIGYDDISDFRNVIQGTGNNLQRDDDYSSARQRAEEQKKRLLQLAGKIVTSPTMLYDEMNEALKKEEFDLRIADKDSYQSVSNALKEKINQEDRVQKRLSLGELAKEIAALRAATAKMLKSEMYLKAYNELVSEKATIGQIHLSSFLTAGAKVIDGGYVSDAQCPFCLGPSDLRKLRTEIEGRLEPIAHANKRLEAASPSVEELIGTVLDAKNYCDKIYSRCEKLDSHKELREAASALSTKLSALHSNLNDVFKRRDLIKISGDFPSQIHAIDTTAQKHQSLVSEEIDALKFTAYENRIITLLERIRDLREAFYYYDKNSKIVAAFEKQILSLGEVFDRFIQVQNTALQSVLDKISKDVGDYYKKLHPNENVDRVRLGIVGEEGIEFEYYFYGKRTHPPMKYLSESHLNSLGVVLFLASAKIFNRRSKFLVLDDIVTSFDVNHRRRLLRLIKEEFSDWQIILLTHDAFWFDIIKKELRPEGWLIHELSCDDENGIQIEPSAEDLTALIAVKRKKFDVSNDLRKLLEATLKEICFSCKAKMVFRYNDQNERRMSGELLSELKSAVNQRCAELKDHKIFANLEGSNSIASIGSHDNVEKISDGDIDIVLSDIKQLHDLFACPKCGRYVEADRQLAGKNKIACKCGHKELDWK